MRSSQLAPLHRRRTGSAGHFFPLGIDGGRELVHLLEEHCDSPNIFVFQRGGEARHSRETDSMLHLPERDGLGIIFNPILG
jgi:hypothetical protein